MFRRERGFPAEYRPGFRVDSQTLRHQTSDRLRHECGSNPRHPVPAAEFFKQAGFDVLRIKIEAMAYGIDGIPQTIDEALKFSDCYFEFHILVQHVEVGDDARPQLITPKEEAELRRISNVVSKNLHVPVPLSFVVRKQFGKMVQ